MAVDFGEVRSALHANPSSLGWERLCRLCEDAEEREWEEQLWPYLERELERWPLTLREAPPRWVRQAMELGRSPPAARLGAALRVTLTQQSWADGFDLRRLAALAHPGLLAVSLRAERLDTRRLGAALDLGPLLSSERLSGLREVELSDQLLSVEALHSIAQNKALRSLEVMGVHIATLDAALLEALIALYEQRAISALSLGGLEIFSQELNNSTLWHHIRSLELKDLNFSRFNQTQKEFPRLKNIKNLSIKNINHDSLLNNIISARCTDNLETLCMDQLSTSSYSALINRLKHWRLRALRWVSLQLNTRWSEELAISLRDEAQLEQIEALDLDRSTQRAFLSVIGALGLPALQVLRLGSALDMEQVAQLERAELPRLRHLELRLIDAGDESTQALRRRLLAIPWIAELSALRLHTQRVNATIGAAARLLDHSPDGSSAPLWRCGGELNV